MSNEYDTIITLDFTTEVQYTYLDCTVIKKQEVKEVTDMILESIWNTTLQLSKLILDLIIEIQYDVHGLRTVRKHTSLERIYIQDVIKYNRLYKHVKDM